MGIISKIFTGVSGIYNNINPVTLSGVNDVIVVKNGDDDYKCSPFQLRFSKLGFINSKTQIVHLYVNGKMTDINMTITSQGDLYFEEQRAADVTNNDKVVDYLQSEEPGISPILQDRLECIKLNGNPTEKELQLQSLNEARQANLALRLFAKSNFVPIDELYKEITIANTKFSNIISSSEHYLALLEKHKGVCILLESLIRCGCHLESGCPGATVQFSVCMNCKVEKSLDDTFNMYLTKEVDLPENTAVRIEGCKRNHLKVYLPYMVFVKMFFEVRGCRNREKKTLEILEKEHNKTLGWNIFGTKKAIKRDISFSLILNSAELKSLELNPGKNDVVFKVSASSKQLEGSIFLWDSSDKVIISDVDGTITKSDIWGHVYGFMGKDWTHTGVAALYTRIVKNGYKIIYLTARPLGQSASTKNYLRGVSQDSFSLPDGPIICSPDGFFEAIYREVILKKPEEFKIHCLNTIKGLFNGINPFVAGFGNKITDVFTYKALNIPNNKIYTINPMGQLQAEYSKSLVGTYHTMNEFIDSIFPCLNKEIHKFNDHEFSDFSWWKA